MHALTHPSIVPSGRGLCDRCERRPGVHPQADGDVICHVCEDNRNEALAEQQFCANLADGAAVPTTNAERYRQRREAR